MKMLILDPQERKRLIRERRRTGADRFDEVWDGVYVVSPIADNEHQYVAGKLTSAIDQAVGGEGVIRVFPAVNVSDREADWRRNYRCPDVAVFVPGNGAIDFGTHWRGGPDFAIEVVSRYDRSRRKGPFYAKVGVRELLVVDRRPWLLELYRAADDDMDLVGVSEPEHSQLIASTVLPLQFRLLPHEGRPRIEVLHAETGRQWLV